MSEHDATICDLCGLHIRPAPTGSGGWWHVTPGPYGGDWDHDATPALAPQPAPSVPAGAAVAAVLRELVAIRREIDADGWSLDSDINWDRAMGNAYTVVARMAEIEAQAATGARAAGGESEALHALSDRLLDKRDWVRVNLGDTPKNTGRRLGLEEAAGMARDLADELAAAQPTPSAPGVAELLAECARLQARDKAAWGFANASMRCDEIVRLLTPGGADGGEG